MTTINAFVPASHVLKSEPADLTTTIQKARSPLTTEQLAEKVDQQIVLPGASLQANEQLVRLLDTSSLGDEDASRVGAVADLITQRSSNELTFDPANWEKHTGVLVAAIVAFNISRQASAELRGMFSVLAEKAAKEQGAAITAAGSAAMASAIAGAVTAVTMTVAGTKMSLDSHSRKPASAAGKLDDALPKPISGGKDLMPGKNAAATTGSAPVAEKPAPEQNVDKPDPQGALSDQNPLTEYKRDRNLRIGQAVTSLATIVSGMFSSMLRMGEYAQREIETLKQSEQATDKGTSEQMAQQIAQAGKLIDKLLATIDQINQGRNATVSTIASSVRV